MHGADFLSVVGTALVGVVFVGIYYAFRGNEKSVCPRCGAEIRPSVKSCRFCRAKFQAPRVVPRSERARRELELQQEVEARRYLDLHQESLRARDDEKQRQETARQSALREKYQDEHVVQRLMNRALWVGASEDQVRDAWGAPAAIDTKVLKTKRKEVWKYEYKGSNRFGKKVTMENGHAVIWDVTD